eukprot:CAMPEP_0167784000 /NCGR_PEP_ID=MMETSP0111_2-20121227/7389_1 /TAXON_ID=91324 /ORGANISM="Lotharella globosa, Strain CCCM811" /LENGTH=38 /DNA_ID= /DNA_START= /DNA_END= /DNA_ORIENTATION=
MQSLLRAHEKIQTASVLDSGTNGFRESSMETDVRTFGL